MRPRAPGFILLVSLALAAGAAFLPLFPPCLLAQSPSVVLNEFLPAPRDVDWDGDGTASNLDEWIVKTVTTMQRDSFAHVSATSDSGCKPFT